MKSQKTVLFHCQHSMGMGHLVRSLTLAKSMAKNFNVVLLNGGELPEGMNFPSEIEVIHLPPIGQRIDHSLYSINPQFSLEEARAKRLEQILNVFKSLQPAALFIELFPFGRKKFINELLPLLETANQVGNARPITVCSLRDILVGNRKDQQQHENRAALLANRYFDAVLMHADHQFAQLEETFQPRIPLETPVIYTGFVVKERLRTADVQVNYLQSDTVLFSAGGGRFGFDIFQRAAEISPMLWENHRLNTKIVAGPFLPEDELIVLRKKAAEIPSLSVVKFVPDLFQELRTARASVSQCGYNTTMDLLQAKIPSLVVPFADGEEDEQLMRARRLKKLGQLQILESRYLNPATLLTAIEDLLDFHPTATELGLTGAEKTGEILQQLIESREANAHAVKPRPRYSDWLTPVKEALNQLPKPVKFFFRNDDAGWRNDRLFPFLGFFEKYDLPIDLAVIPKAVDDRFAERLKQIKMAAPLRIGLHQHGFSHQNRELEGRKCEFGIFRDFNAQYEDIRAGREHLENLIGGDLLDPIFTPPWNRCTIDTANALLLSGFEALSRDETADPFDIPGLIELPIRIDWFRKRKGEPLSRKAFGEYLAEGIRRGKTAGLMFHHAIMDDEDLRCLDELLYLLAAHSYAKFYSMKSLAEIASGKGVCNSGLSAI